MLEEYYVQVTCIRIVKTMLMIMKAMFILLPVKYFSASCAAVYVYTYIT